MNSPFEPITVINLTKKICIELPFSVNRSWDILALLIFISLCFLTFRKNKKGGYTDLMISIPLGAAAGFVFGVMSVITATSLLSSLIICLFIGAGITILVSSVSELKFEIGGAIGYSAITGLSIGIGNFSSLGLIGGLAIAIIFFALISLMVLIAQGIRKLLSKREESEETSI